MATKKATKMAGKSAPVKTGTKVPGKTAAKKSAASRPAKTAVKPHPTHDQISARAQQLWEERGRPEGSAHIDWHHAEEELKR